MVTIQKEAVKLYSKTGEYIGNAYVHIIEKDKEKCFIIESDNRINPAEHISDIFVFLKQFSDNMENIYLFLDLLNYYGFHNSGWLYEVKFKTENDKIKEINFTKIEEWTQVPNQKIAEILNDYLFNKLKEF